MTGTHQDAYYWVGSLSTTIAHAVTSDDPKPLLKTALQAFLETRPPGNELGDLLRATIREEHR